MLGASGRSSPNIEWREPPNNSMQQPALRAAADAERWPDEVDLALATRGAEPGTNSEIVVFQRDVLSFLLPSHATHE